MINRSGEQIGPDRISFHMATISTRITTAKHMTASAHIIEPVEKDSVPAHISKSAEEDSGEIDSIVETEDERRTRLSVYHEIKHLLIAKVIPEHEIAFVHDYDGSAAMVELSRKLNAGEICTLTIKFQTEWLLNR
jgi:hypothetical protein